MFKITISRPAQSELDRARKLQEALVCDSQALVNKTLPKYKFFTDLIEILLSERIKTGARVESSFIEIKKSLVKDLKESKKLKEIITSSILQQLFLMFYILAFSFTLNMMLGSNENNLLSLAVFLILGITIFIIVIYKLKKYRFSKFDLYFFSLYKLKTYMSISLPLNQVIINTNIHNLPTLKKNEFIKKRVIEMLKQVQTSGRLNLQDVDLLIEELWNCYLFEMEIFKKNCLAFKLVFLMIFGLPSFLITVMQMINKLSL